MDRIDRRVAEPWFVLGSVGLMHACTFVDSILLSLLLQDHQDENFWSIKRSYID